MKNKARGFTLIELLVVIAIIAILSTVVMAGLNTARSKGRDAKRISDAKQMQAALELFFDSCGGYPGDAAIDVNLATVFSAAGCTAPTTMASFMNPFPVNPTPIATGFPADYRYCAAPTGATVCNAAERASYVFQVSLENQSGSIQAGLNHFTPAGVQTAGVAI